MRRCWQGRVQRLLSRSRGCLGHVRTSGEWSGLWRAREPTQTFSGQNDNVSSRQWPGASRSVGSLTCCSSSSFRRLSPLIEAPQWGQSGSARQKTRMILDLLPKITNNVIYLPSSNAPHTSGHLAHTLPRLVCPGICPAAHALWKGGVVHKCEHIEQKMQERIGGAAARRRPGRISLLRKSSSSELLSGFGSGSLYLVAAFSDSGPTRSLPLSSR